MIKQEAYWQKAIRVRGIAHCLYSVIAISIYYPAVAVSQEPTLLPQVAHTKCIRSIAVSPDERYVWSGGEDGKCAMWDLRTMKVLEVLAEQESDQFLGKYPIVNAVAWSPNSKYIASGGQDGNLIVWEVSSRKRIFKEAFGRSVCAIEFSEDSKDVFVGLKDGEIKVYRVEVDEVFIPFGDVTKPNRFVSELRGHEGEVSFIKRLDGKKVISVSSVWTGEKSSIKIWDLESKKQVKAFSELQDRVYSMAVSPDGNYIAMVGSAKTVRIWDLESGHQVLTIKGVTDNQYEQCSLAYTADGKTLVLGEINSTKFFDVKTGKLKQRSRIAALNLIYLQKEKVFLATLDKQIRLLDAEKGVLIRTSSSFELGSAMECVAIHPSQNIFVTGGGDGRLRIWDMQTASLKQVIDSKSKKMISMKITPDGKTVITTDGTEIKIFEIESAKLKRSINVDNVNTIAVSSDGNELAAGSDDQTIRIWNLKTGNQIEQIVLNGRGRVLALEFGMDSKTVFCATALSELLKVNRERKTIEKFAGRYSGQAGKITMMSLRGDGKQLITGDITTSDPKQWDIESLKLERILGESLEKESSDSRKVPKMPMSSLTRKRDKNAHTGSVISVVYHPNRKESATGSTDRQIKIWDIESGKCLRTLRGHTGEVTQLNFTADGKFLISGSRDGTAKVWNLQTGKCITFSANDDQWIIYTEDGYWDGSEGCENLVAIVRGLDVWNIDQFAAKNNRPDIILQNLGYADSEEVMYFQKQYQKRLKRLKVENEKILSEGELPVTRILEAVVKDNFLKLKINFQCKSSTLRSYNIYVNNVPLFSGIGKPLEGQNKEVEEMVELNEGLNKVEVSCINGSYQESFRALTYILNEKPVKRNLYYLGFGVSKYKDTELNLDYADKDVKDLERVLKQMEGKGFAKVYSKTYLNEEVTQHAIHDAKEFLKQAKVDDILVLFIAGHGMHSRDIEANYYFLTSQSRIDNIESEAIEFESFEDLLSGIRLRSKLFLIDACESGELDEFDELSEMRKSEISKLNEKAGIKSRGIKKEIMQRSNKSGRKYLYNRNRYIYNDLTRRSGAIVFSSSKGNELSYESREMENGLFTEYITRALSTVEADENKDGVVSVRELRGYVALNVSEISNGLQNPVVDRNNIFQDFGFKIK